MPYLVTTLTYPTDKASRVAETYLQALQQYPTDENLETELIPAAVKSTTDGLRVLSISEVKEGKLDEAYKYRIKFMVLFQPIEGLEYTVDVNLTVAEGLEVLGIS